MPFLIPLLIFLGIIGFALGGDVLGTLGNISLSPTAPLESVLKQTGWIQDPSERSAPRSTRRASGSQASSSSSSPSSSASQAQQEENQGTLQIQSFRPTDNSRGRHFQLVLRPKNLSSPLSITGWRVQSQWAGAFTIGKGAELFHPSLNSSNNDEILVRPGDTVLISGQAGPLGSKTNFKTNSCFGYLAPYYSNLPGSSSCSVSKPSLQEVSHLLPSCQEYLLSELNYSSCTIPEIPAPRLDSRCREIAREITDQMNYNACYQKRAQEPDFLSSTWYLHENREFGHPLHDVITLKDAAGNVIDQYTY